MPLPVLAGEERAWGTMSGWAEKGAPISVANSRDALHALSVGGTHDQKFTVWDGKTETAVPVRKAVALACLKGRKSVKPYANDGEKDCKVVEGRSAVKLSSQEQF